MDYWLYKRRLRDSIDYTLRRQSVRFVIERLLIPTSILERFANSIKKSTLLCAGVKDRCLVPSSYH